MLFNAGLYTLCFSFLPRILSFHPFFTCQMSIPPSLSSSSLLLQSSGRQTFRPHRPPVVHRPLIDDPCLDSHLSIPKLLFIKLFFLAWVYIQGESALPSLQKSVQMSLLRSLTLRAILCTWIRACFTTFKALYCTLVLKSVFLFDVKYSVFLRALLAIVGDKLLHLSCLMQQRFISCP